MRLSRWHYATRRRRRRAYGNCVSEYIIGTSKVIRTLHVKTIAARTHGSIVYQLSLAHSLDNVYLIGVARAARCIVPGRHFLKDASCEVECDRHDGPSPACTVILLALSILQKYKRCVRLSREDGTARVALPGRGGRRGASARKLARADRRRDNNTQRYRIARAHNSTSRKRFREVKAAVGCRLTFQRTCGRLLCDPPSGEIIEKYRGVIRAVTNTAR
ncbi:hypothetical protein EVAR_86523_1 [Eumeta japonica]|uniref:Uncharacterized protein n=1 Tax=Eumeta variegata TaxID=151549 RepID=A0A4C1VPU9_EUMVA|nr:hypothetical protein EVAR_86523_1 [Eumeta japonica]